MSIFNSYVSLPEGTALKNCRTSRQSARCAVNPKTVTVAAFCRRVDGGIPVASGMRIPQAVGYTFCGFVWV